MKKSPLFFLFYFTFFLGFFFKFIFAYDANSTHPNLTEITVDYFNKISSRKISEKEKEWLKDGSIKEDDGIRSINHFYDPIYNTTYKIFGIENLLPALTAKEWAQNQLAQALYDPNYLGSLGAITKSPIFSSANRTFQRAIYEYIKGNYKEAFVSLGHILHLIQDMSVPEHTRANIHIYFLKNTESHYELYTARKEASFYENLRELLKNRNEIVLKNSLNDYFDYLANYSNNNFYSPDTIDNLKYKLPEVSFYDVPEINKKTNVIEYFLMGTDENKQLYHLAQKKALSWRWQSGFTNYTLANEKVLEDYWQRLSYQSVITSSGVINLFFKEVERAKLNPNFLSQNEKSLLLAFWGGIRNVLKNFSNNQDYILVEPSSNFNNHSTNDLASKETPATLEGNRLDDSSLKNISLKDSSSLNEPSLKTNSNSSNNSSFLACQYKDGNNQKALRDSVIFNEINWMGSFNSSNDEWIEIKNISKNVVDLSYWQIIDKDNQINFVFPFGTKILPNQIMVLERNSDDVLPFIKADYFYKGALNNENEGLRLFNELCLLEDEVLANPKWPAGDNVSKRSMERKNDFSWQTYFGEMVNGVYGTPGKENSQLIQENNENQSDFIKASKESLMATTTLSSVVNSFQSQPTAESKVTTTTTTTTTSTTTTTTKPVKILINEIKISGRKEDGTINAYDEFIELFNPNSFSVDLTGYYLQRKTSSGSTYSLVPSSLLEEKTIPPFGFFLIAHSSSSYEGLANVLTSYSLTENNTVILKGPDKNVIDKVGYGNAPDCETQCALNIEPGKSIQRKMIDGLALDTDNNFNDFEVLNCPTPLNQDDNCFNENQEESLNSDNLKIQSSEDSNDNNNQLKDSLDSFPLKNLSWHPLDESNSKIVLEFDILDYPFISNTNETNNFYFGVLFFLNEDNPETIPLYLYQKDFWQIQEKEVLIFNYPNCQNVQSPIGGIYFTSDSGNCFSVGLPRGYAFAFNSLPKDNHFLIEIKGTNFNENRIFQKEDFITIGLYSFLPYSDSTLKLISYNSQKYYFQPDFYYHPPLKVKNFVVNFNGSVFNFSWEKGEDKDNNDYLTYEIHYVLKQEGDNLLNNNLTRLLWSQTNPISFSSLNYSFDQEVNRYFLDLPLKELANFNPVVCEPTTLYFGIRAKDKYGFYSEISDIQEITLFPSSQNFNSLSDFIENLKWYFNEGDKMVIEFDLIKRNECLKNYQWFVIKAGWDYEPGLIFLSGDGSPWNIEKNRPGGRFQNNSDKLFISNYPPSLGHYQIVVNNFYHLNINNGSPVNNFTRRVLEEEFQKLNKNLEDIYLILAFGAADQNYSKWFFYNSSSFNQPETIRLNF